jgi:DNA-directed RNA polymerase specialized sigma24 family protein
VRGRERMSLRENLDRRRPGREGLVAAEWRDLVRIAYLLTGHRGDAEELAAAALTRRPGGCADLARRRLVRHATSRWQRWVRRVHRFTARRPPVSSEPLPAEFLACLQLPVRERVALVLRYGVGCSEAEVGAALAAEPGEVGRLTARALTRLRTALAGREYDVAGVLALDLGEHGHGGDSGRLGDGEEPLVGRLQAALGAAAARVRLPDGDEPGAGAGVGRALRRARQHELVGGLVTAAAVAVTVLLAVALVPVVPRAVGAGGSAPDDDATIWPTRGSLAGRGDLVAQVRAVVGGRQPVIAVPFLGEVAGLGVALAVTQGGRDQEVRVLYGPTTAPVAGWSREDGARLATGRPAVLTVAIDDGTGLVHLLALTTTTGWLRLAWSPTAVMDADGFLRRRYTEFALHDGVGVASAPGDLASFAMRVWRTTGTPGITIAPFTITARPRTSAPFGAVSGVRAPSCRSSPLPLTLDRALGTLVSQGHLARADIQHVDLPWCRSEGAHDRMLVAITDAHGSAVQALVDGTKTGMGGYWWSMRSRPAPAGRAATYPFTVVADDEDVIPDRGPLRILVSAPAAAVAEIREPGRQAPLAVARLDDEGYGIGVIAAENRHVYLRPDPGLRLVLLNGAGREIEQVAARLDHDDDPWGEHLDGPVGPAA